MLLKAFRLSDQLNRGVSFGCFFVFQSSGEVNPISSSRIQSLGHFYDASDLCKNHVWNLSAGDTSFFWKLLIGGVEAA